LAEPTGSRGCLRRVPGYERGVVRRVRDGVVVPKGPARLLNEGRRRQLGVHAEFLKDGFDLRSHGRDRHGRPSGDRLGGAPLCELGQDVLLAPSQDLERGQAGLGLAVVGLDQPLPKVFPKEHFAGQLAADLAEEAFDVRQVARIVAAQRDLARIETILNNPAASTHWNRIANQRKQRINKYLWSDKLGLFVDYDFRTHQQSHYRYLTTFYALWSGLASPQQARRLAANLALFERRGGLQMSTDSTGEQWDAPFGWAPTNWLAVAGLARYGYTADARRIAREFTSTIRNSFQRDHTIREKYNMDTASSAVAITTGYKTNVVGFGWTNGVYLRMEQLLLAKTSAASH